MPETSGGQWVSVIKHRDLKVCTVRCADGADFYNPVLFKVFYLKLIKHNFKN